MAEDYERALEAAGATVLIFEHFGSYQGDWWAKVTWQDKEGWVHGCFGSCSGCDAFEAEFGFVSHDCGEDDYYDPFCYDDRFRKNCPRCQELEAQFIEFGQDYLEQIMTQEEAETEASTNLDWDMDATEMLKFLKDNCIV